MKTIDRKTSGVTLEETERVCKRTEDDAPKLGQIEPPSILGLLGWLRRALGPENLTAEEIKNLEWDSYDIGMPWKEFLHLKASTYDMGVVPFPDLAPSPYGALASAQPYQVVYSRQGTFAYQRRLLPAGHYLNNVNGKKIGHVAFDEEIAIPILLEQLHKRWTIWMSLTPQEIFTLRPGTRRAQGTTVIAGLGLGHQAIQVSKRRRVEKIIIVERSQELVDFIWDEIKPHIEKPVELIVGNAWSVFPELTADVALIDIYESYGDNRFATERFRKSCPNIKTVWGWGDASLG